jgi:hypothetical protein
MAVRSPEALARRQLERVADDGECDARPPELRAHRQPLQFCKAAEEPHAQARRRLVAHPTDEMQAAEIVAVELLVIGAGLVPHVDDGPDGGGAQKLVQRADDRHTLLGAQRWTCYAGHGQR